MAVMLLLVGQQAKKVEFTLHVVPTTVPLLLPSLLIDARYNNRH